MASPAGEVGEGRRGLLSKVSLVDTTIQPIKSTRPNRSGGKRRSVRRSPGVETGVLGSVLYDGYYIFIHGTHPETSFTTPQSACCYASVVPVHLRRPSLAFVGCQCNYLNRTASRSARLTQDRISAGSYSYYDYTNWGHAYVSVSLIRIGVTLTNLDVSLNHPDLVEGCRLG